MAGTPEKAWTSEIWAIHEDLPSCLLGYCCPCILHGQTVDKMKGGGMEEPTIRYCLYSCLCVPCLVAGPNRTEMRQKYGLAEAPVTDMIAHFPLITLFSNCQEAREMTKHAAEPASGSATVTVAPTAEKAPEK